MITNLKPIYRAKPAFESDKHAAPMGDKFNHKIFADNQALYFTEKYQVPYVVEKYINLLT
jgi:hypothetical protein